MIFLSSNMFKGRVFLGWRQTVHFTVFSAEMVFWESPLFPTEMTMNWLLLRKILWNMLFFTLQHYSSIWQLLEENKILALKFFKKTVIFFVISNEKSKFSNTVSAKKSVKHTGCLQPRKTLFKVSSLVQGIRTTLSWITKYFFNHTSAVSFFYVYFFLRK